MSSFTITQMEQLANVLEKAGWTAEDIAKARQGSHVADFRRVIHGHAVIQTVKHVVDCDAAPFCPEGLTVEYHQPGGQLELDSQKIQLYLSDRQKASPWIKGHDLRKELEGKPVLNANALDYYLAHPELIPEAWKGKAIFFWGTIYRRSGGRLYVRYLYWGGSRWDWSCSWLDDDWGDRYPAALLASAK